MNKYRTVLIPGVLMILSSLVTSVVASILFSYQFAKNQYGILSSLVGGLIEAYPQAEQDIMLLLKNGLRHQEHNESLLKDYLMVYGFKPDDLLYGYRGVAVWSAVLGTITVLLIFFCIYMHHKHIVEKRTLELTKYLENINTDGKASILPDEEDLFAPLQDEIYKTVTNLYSAREMAVKERGNFAKNLANIAHQIKTPVASLTLGVQLLEDKWGKSGGDLLRRQISRMEELVEALLTLSRVDAGVLILEKREVDVYTLLELSAEAIDEITNKKNLQIIIPNHPEITFWGDMDWSVEAFINLLKNCGEYTPEGGKIIADYKKNPLYTEIVITDSGEGFLFHELPHVFERFYRGERSGGNGIGIGLSLAKDLIEMQNGFLTAENGRDGGACFTARFYSH